MTTRNGTTYKVNNLDDTGTGNKDDEYDVRCGYGSCKPNGLQKCNNPKLLLVLLCIFALGQGKV